MNHDAPLPPADYERTDASPIGIILTGTGIAAGVFAVIVAAAAFSQTGPRAWSVGPDGRFEHATRAQTGIARDWAEQDRLVREHLETYGWIDRGHGIAHIPVARAMEIVIAEDAATRTKAEERR